MKGLLRKSSAVFQWKLYREILAASERCPPSIHHQTATACSLLSRQHVPQAFSFVPLSASCAVYSKCASNGRPFQAWLYTQHTAQHQLLYEETLASSTLDVALTRDGQFVTINSNTRTDSEVHIMRSVDVEAGVCEPLLVRAREERVEYYMEHGHDVFYILTNASDHHYYQVMTAASNQPSYWSSYYQPPHGTVLTDLELYSNGLLLYCLKDGAPIVAALHPEHREPVHTLVGDEFTEVTGGGGHYTSSHWPVLFSSPIGPPTATSMGPLTATGMGPPTATGMGPLTAINTGPPTAINMGPPMATGMGPPTATGMGPLTAINTGPPTAINMGPPTATGMGPPTATGMGPLTAINTGPPTAINMGPPMATSMGPPTATGMGPLTAINTGPPTAINMGPPMATSMGPPTATGMGPLTAINTGPPTAINMGPPMATSMGPPTVPASLHIISPSDGRYCIERREAVSTDGTLVPLTLCYKRGALKGSHLNPVLVHVYGCYGECVPIGWQAEGLPLLERGWVMAYAHTRGGGERGRGWYHDGMARNKHKTFQDLAACVKSVQCDISQPSLTALVGRSAGGLAVGMFCNLWPQLLHAAILQVPLVNLCHTLSDLTSYLTCKDTLEFGGHPLGTISEREHITSICPYSTLQPQDYPAVYVSASRSDEVIPFTGVAHYVSRLRQCGANVVFKVDSVYGHYDNGDAEQRASNAAKHILFLYKTLQLDNTH